MPHADAWNPVLERFRRCLEDRRYSPRTVDAYSACLRRYAEWLAPLPPQAAGEPAAFLAELVAGGAGRSVVDQHAAALRLLHVDLWGWPPERVAVARPPRPVPARSVPSRAEVLRLARGAACPRDRLAILLLYGSGLRVGELVRLDLGDLDCRALLVRVRPAGGRPARLSVLSGQLAGELTERQARRSALDPVLESRQGGRLTTRAVQAVVAAARSRAGLVAPLTPQDLRRAFGVHLRQGGADPAVVQALLGHARLATTARLLGPIGPHGATVRSPL